MATLIERTWTKNMGPGYPDPMAAGSADPGAQCSDEQLMAPGAWSVKQGLFPGWLIGVRVGRIRDTGPTSPR